MDDEEDQYYSNWPLSSDDEDEDAALRLLALCEKSQWKPDPNAVKQCVKDGANVCYYAKKVDRTALCTDGASKKIEEKPILMHLVESHSIEAALACLWFPSPEELPNCRAKGINFTATDCAGRTILELLCESTISDEDSEKLLRVIVDHIHKCVDDTIDWSLGGKCPSQSDFEFGDEVEPQSQLAGWKDTENMLQLAASAQKLHFIWPLLKNEPFFLNLSKPIALKKVWAWDFEKLAHGDQQCFSLEEADVTPGDRSTGKFVQLCWLRNWKITASEVQLWVDEGADVCFTDIHMRMPILHHLVLNEDLHCFKAALSTKHVINFNCEDVNGATVIHEICSFLKNQGEKVSFLWEVLLDRLAATTPSLFCHDIHSIPADGHPDTINWLHEDKFGNNFFSTAAYYGNLSLVWNILKARKVSFFHCSSIPSKTTERHEDVIIPLKMRIFEWDWNELSSGDMLRFAPLKYEDGSIVFARAL